MKTLHLAIALLLLAGGIPAAAHGPGRPVDTLYQVSTLAALQEGDYDGRVDFDTVMQEGDFGLGTFAALDGEMVAVDGLFYQVRADGIATPVARGQLTPFAAVTRFQTDESFHVSGPVSCLDFYRSLQERFTPDRIVYAIRVTGRFTSLQTRSVPAQEKPYPPLAEALLQQVVFDFAEVDAVLAGFWMPPVVADVNVPGFHFHAILPDLQTGGHVLDCVVREVDVEIDRKQELHVQFADAIHGQPSVPGPGQDSVSREIRSAVTNW